MRLKSILDAAVFPLFELASASSRRAVLANAEAVAPELKKGIRMAVHHSRDTTQKQWSETQALALKGLARLLKTVTRNMLGEVDAWYRQSWTDALHLVHRSINAATAAATSAADTTAPAVEVTSGSNEIAAAAIEMLFVMLRTVSSNAPSATPTAAAAAAAAQKKTGNKGFAADANAMDDAMASAEREAARDELWQLTWTSVQAAAGLESLTPVLALKVVEHLAAMCEAHVPEFRYSANIQGLFETVVVLSRPRVAKSSPVPVPVPVPVVPSQEDRVSEMQLQRAVVGLLKAVRPVDSLAFMALVSCLCELSFACQTVLSANVGTGVALGPCAPKLRADAGAYLLDILKQSLVVHDSGKPQQLEVPIVPRGLAVAVLDVVVKRYHYDLFDAAIAARRADLDSGRRSATEAPEEEDEEVAPHTPGIAPSKSPSSAAATAVGGFMSWSFGRILGGSPVADDGAVTSSSTASRVHGSAVSPQKNAMHKLPHVRSHAPDRKRHV